MIRVAQVKFGRHSKTYDYLCEDKTIKEGDVVSIEGKSTPVFIYAIKEIEPTPGIKYAKVIMKLKENENVTIITKYMNIIDSKCECIVNSLGPDTSIFGNICESIMYNANSDEMRDMLNNNPHANIYDMFVTDAGRLPSKHVIHIVMPFKKDDKFNENLRKAFMLVIDKAISLGYKSIAIPGIGTGANGYNKKDIYDAIDDVIFKYMYTPNIEIEIQSIIFASTSKQRQHIIDEIECERRQKKERIMSQTDACVMPQIDGDLSSPSIPKPKKKHYELFISDLRDNTRLIHEYISENYNPKDEIKVIKTVEFPYRSAYSFMDTYIAEYGKEAFVGYKKYVTRMNDISELRIGKKILKKIDVFNMAMGASMNFTNFIQFMTLAGFTFSPIKELDLEVLKYALNNNGFSKGLVHSIEYFNENCSRDIAIEVCPPETKSKVAA